MIENVMLVIFFIVYIHRAEIVNMKNIAYKLFCKDFHIKRYISI